MKFTLKVFSGRKVVRRSFTKSARRFTHFLRTLNLENGRLKALIKVEYEDGPTNEGEYTDKSEVMKAFRAFCEK